MNPLILLFRAYWMQLTSLAICLFIVGYIGVLRHENNALKRDNASLQATIDLTKAIGKSANEKANRIEQGAHAAAIASTNQYLYDLEKVKKYNETHPNIKFIPNSVRQPATNTSSGEVCSTPASPAGIDASAADEISSGPSLEAECRITTLMLLRLQDFEREQQTIH